MADISNADLMNALMAQGAATALSPGQDYWDMSPEERQLRDIRLNSNAINRLGSFAAGMVDNPATSKNLQEIYPPTIDELRDRHPDAYDYGRTFGRMTGANGFWNWLYGERMPDRPAPTPPVRRNKNEI